MNDLFSNPWLKFQPTHANLHYIVAEISRIAITLEIAGRVSAGSVPAHSTHDLAFIDVCAKKQKERKKKSLGAREKFKSRQSDQIRTRFNSIAERISNVGEEWAHRYI